MAVIINIKNKNMKRNLKVPCTYYNGQPLTRKEGDKDVHVMIHDIVSQALFDISTGVSLTPDEKYQAFRVSQKICSKPESVELEAKDIVLIKKIIAPSFSAGVYGQIVDLLEK